MAYVDGFVIPVPGRKLDEYRRLSRLCSRIWLELGALEYNEAIADDVKPGKVTSFPRSVKLRRGETVIFAWIVYRSRAHRDSVNARAMRDPRLAGMDPGKLPFDAKRFIWGGFKTFIRASRRLPSS